MLKIFGCLRLIATHSVRHAFCSPVTEKITGTHACRSFNIYFHFPLDLSSSMAGKICALCSVLTKNNSHCNIYTCFKCHLGLSYGFAYPFHFRNYTRNEVAKRFVELKSIIKINDNASCLQCFK